MPQSSPAPSQGAPFDVLLNGNGEPRRFGAASPLDPANEEGLLEKLVRLLRNRWLVVLQAMIVIPLATLIFSLAQQKSYTAKATLLFEPPSQNAGSLDLARQAATQAKLVALPGIADRAAALLGQGWTERRVRDAVSVDGSTDTDLITVSASAHSPRKAAAVANAYAAAFIASQDTSNLEELQRSLAVYDRYLSSLPPSQRTGPRGLRLQQRLDSLKISSALQSNGQQPGVQLRQRAELPTSASSPKTKLDVGLGLLLGIALGLSLAALLERLDRGIKSVEELEHVYGLPVLARIPRTRGLDKRLRELGAREVMRLGPQAEAFRALRANLRYFNVDGGLRSLMVVSAEAKDGKSTVAACLATTLAQRGDRVLLVEADFHKSPSLDGGSREASTSAEAVGAGGVHRTGLSTVLAGGDLDDALVTVPMRTGDGNTDELTVLPSGPPPPNPSELLASRRMRELMLRLGEDYDLVVYDTPAVAAVSDALPLLPPEGAGVIVVSRLHHTSRDRALELLKQLSLLRAHVLGVVANYAPVNRQRGYDYYRS
jgi:succinoglycan biosynthesis transport protein ExoP